MFSSATGFLSFGFSRHVLGLAFPRKFECTEVSGFPQMTVVSWLPQHECLMWFQGFHICLGFKFPRYSVDCMRTARLGWSALRATSTIPARMACRSLRYGVDCRCSIGELFFPFVIYNMTCHVTGLFSPEMVLVG